MLILYMCNSGYAKLKYPHSAM